MQSEPIEPEAPVARKTGTWSLSLGIHALIALVVAFFWVVQVPAEEIPPTVVTPRPKVKEPVSFDPDRPPVETKLDVPTTEQVVFTKEQVERELETPDEDDFRQAKGTEGVTLKPFKSKATNDAIGGGGGGAGRLGKQRGGRILKAGAGGGGPKTEDAVLEALKWLARHQEPDGSWRVNGFVARCTQACSPHPGHDDFDPGVTGLSLLAFLGSGYSHKSREVHDGICFGDVVRKGLQWMMSHQDPEGCIGSRNHAKYMYNHTVCALALTEAYGLTGSAIFRDQAQKAVDFTIAAQTPGKGWRYAARSGESDGSVTGWAVMVLKSAELSGLAFPASGYEGTRAWYDETTETAYGRTGYMSPRDGKVFVPGLNEAFNHHESLTAISMMARIFMDRNPKDPRLEHGAGLLLRDLPKWDGNAIDFYYWYYASMTLYQLDGPKGAKWREWNGPMVMALTLNQNPKSSGCRRGSWEPVGRWCGEGGRVYATAINALTLEVYYRYPNAFGNR